MSRLQQHFLRFSIGALTLVPASILASCSNTSQQGQGLNAVDNSSGDVCQLSGTGTLLGTVGTIINTLFIVAGAVAVIIMIMGGIRYITSTGDSKRIQAAKDTILYAVIGLVVVILGRAIVGFVIGQIAL
jgi:hypothetical protein